MNYSFLRTVSQLRCLPLNSVVERQLPSVSLHFSEFPIWVNG